MYSVTKRIDFCYGHRLLDYEGVCKHPHGHNAVAEIQVRTIAQHAWSDIGHDRMYKTDCDIPDFWKRESNRIAAVLEDVDDAFSRLVKGIALFVPQR